MFSQEDFNDNNVFSYSLTNKKRKEETSSGSVNDN